MTAEYVTDIEQGTAEWHGLRLGIPTASCFDKVVTPAKGELSKQADTYANELLAEWLSGEPGDTFTSRWMERGTALEEEARAFYAFDQDVDVRQVGFVFSSVQRTMGCSPDGLVGDVGMVEFKCPKPGTHIGYLRAGVLPTTYRAQVQGSLLVTGREWCDFVSYCPGLPPFRLRCQRDEKFIGVLRDALDAFIVRLEQGRAELTRRGYSPLREAA